MMANFTKISPYRAGPPRFGRAPGEEPANGPVITYRLSPEEIARRYGPPGDSEWRGEDMPSKLDISKEQIENALRVTQGNAKKAIEILKIGVGTFYSRVKEFGIDVASFRAPEAGTGGTQDAGPAEVAKEAADPVLKSAEPESASTETAGPETWETHYEEPAYPALEIPEPEPFKEPASSQLANNGGATEDIFSTWLRIKRNYTGTKENAISIDKRGTVRLLSDVGSAFKLGDRVEFFLSPDKTRLALRKTDDADGFRLRSENKSKAKICNCGELKNLLLEAGVELPARFAAQWGERLQAWIGRRCIPIQGRW
jgi:hypothetical protein